MIPITATIIDSLFELLVSFLLNFGEPESVRQFINVTYAGISDGALLGLIALGLVLIFKATDVINFANGEIMVLGAYIAYEFLVPKQMPILQALILAGLIMLGFGVLVERFILRPLIGEPVISVIMITIGLSSVIKAGIGLKWGGVAVSLGDTEIFPPVLGEKGYYSVAMEDLRRLPRLQYDNLYVMGVVAILVIIFILFFRYSKEGIAMRAVADDQQAAMSMGISIKRVFAVTWSIAALTAGAAGLMIATLTTQVGYKEISPVGLRAFPVIILGGLDSISGAIISGLIIGLTEQYASTYIDPSLKNVVPYVLLLIVLMIRPYGLFGEERIERV